MDANSLFGARLVGYVMSPEHSVNIDTAEDWERAVAFVTRMMGGSGLLA